MSYAARFGATFAILLLVAAGARAQETRGSIEGTVKDSSGAVLPGVTVEARSPALVGVSSVATDASGVYRFPALPPGIYEISANLTGFTQAQVPNVLLRLGQILKVDFSLDVGGLAESIQVTSESPLIDVKQNAATFSIETELIERLPLGRDFTTAIESAPGANNESVGGGTMIDGASGSENRFIVNGMDTTTLDTGESGKEVLLEFIDEVQVKSSGYNAEYRAATGGVISALTKTGGNNFHGSIGTHYTSNELLGDLRGSLRLNPFDDTQAEYIFPDRDDSYTVEPTMELGGPIFRDRMWFYGGYVPQVSRTKRTVTFTSNGQTQTFESPTEDHNAVWSLTGLFTPNFRYRGSGINERSRGGLSLPSRELDGTSLSNPNNFPDRTRTDSFNDMYTAILDWVATPQTYVNVTTGYFRYGGQTVGDLYDGRQRNFSTTNAVFPDIPASLQHPSGFADNPSNSFTVRDTFTRLNLSADATFYRNWIGQHSFKTGLFFERYGNDVNSGQQGQQIVLFWNRSRNTLANDQVRGPYGYYYVRQVITLGDINSNNLGLFVQDSWTMHDRFTLNYGVRTEREKIPSYRPENPGLEFGFGDKIAPRVGFAWDMLGDHKWKVYGSWGMFYDIFKLEMPRGLFGADRWISYYYTLDDFNWPAIDCEGPPGSGCPGQFIEQVDFRHVSNEPGSELVDPNLKPYRAQEFTVGLDHELTQTISVGARYAHKWIDRTIEDVGVQVPGIGEIYYIANPGEGIATHILGPDFPAQPIPERTYDGVEFRLRRRLSDGWSLNTSLLFSRLYGNYSGLASSDENGRNSPNVNRFFDGLFMNFDQNGNVTLGRLNTDRPIQFELQGTYDLPWGTNLGLYYTAMSGTPRSSQATVRGVPVYYKGRNDLGRGPALMQANVQVAHTFRLPRNLEFTLLANVSNLFDQRTETSFDTTPYQSAIPVSNEEFFAGFDGDAVAAANGVENDPRFLLANGFQSPRRIRLLARFRF